MNLIKFVANKNSCESCIVVKQKVESHNNFVIFDKHFLNLMWSDLVQSFVFYDKVKYFVTFLCDFIKRSMIYVLRVKSNTFDAFRYFQQHNEHEDNRIRRLRTNWEEKYFNDEFDNHRFEHDIEWELIVSKTSKQNEIVERLKQILMSMINIMLKNVDLNDKWWIELIKTINYLRNRFSMINKWITSFEIDTRRKFSFAHLRRIEITNYVMKRKSITKWKKTCFQMIFCRACKLRKKSHLSNVKFQWDHLSCLVCYLNQEKARKIIFFYFLNIDKTIDHRINHIFDKKTSSEVEFDNHFHVFVLTINWCRFILFNTLNNENKHIKHRVDFVNFDSQRSKASL
jgi:hypothetical protein